MRNFRLVKAVNEAALEKRTIALKAEGWGSNMNKREERGFWYRSFIREVNGD